MLLTTVQRRPDFTVVRYHMRTVYWGPLIVSVAAMYFFAAIPQSREVYLSIVEDKSILQAVLGLTLIGLLCGLLNYWQHMLGTFAIDRMYLEHADIHIDGMLLRLRDWLCRFSAYFPLAGVVLGLIKVTIAARGAGTKFTNALADFGGAGNFPEFKDTLSFLPYFPAALAITILIIGVPSVLMIKYARLLEGWRVPTAARIRHWVLLGGITISIAAFVLPLLFKDYVVGVAQFFGPLAAASVTLIALTCVLIGISYLANLWRWPIMGALVLAAIGGIIWKTTVALAPEPQSFAPSGLSSRQVAHNNEELFGAFDNWLAARRTANGKAFEDAGQPYPVFIISSQGGGIYAAASGSAFLASMQDRCPNFSQHVFAISGVSGGAVGSALFAAATPSAVVPTVGCNDSKRLERTGSLSALTRDVVRRDHLSPSLALIWPDLLRKIFLRPDPDFDRSSVLERSFACAFDNPKKRFLRCPAASSKGDTGLRQPFDKSWQIDRATPALILTATWAETGLRTAFAPFPLHAVGDGTLDSFHASGDGTDDFALEGVSIKPSRSLIEAAFVSARFPGIVPAWQQKAQLTGGRRPLIWNFVDGGYVDNSGASTAQDIYKALAAHAKNQYKSSVAIYLVMMTDANTNPNLARVNSGTRFSDLVAPISALLNVRGQLAFRAVTRAIGDIEPDATAKDLAGRGQPSKVLAVNLQQTTFELPLGWKISGVTDDIVRLMLGRPDLCLEKLPDTAGQGEAVGVIRDNSCVKRRIEDLLSARGDGVQHP